MHNAAYAQCEVRNQCVAQLPPVAFPSTRTFLGGLGMAYTGAQQRPLLEDFRRTLAEGAACIINYARQTAV